MQLSIKRALLKQEHQDGEEPDEQSNVKDDAEVHEKQPEV